MEKRVVERRVTGDDAGICLHPTKEANFSCCSKVTAVSRKSFNVDDEKIDIHSMRQKAAQKRESTEKKVESLIKRISIEKGISEKELDEAVENAVVAGKVEMAAEMIGISNLMQLIIAIEKLGIAYRNQLKFCRREERNLQVKEMIAAAENYKQQGKWILNFAIGAGIGGLLAGALPIAGYLKGEWIVDKLSSLGNIKYLGWFRNLDQFRDKPMQLFKNLGTMSQTSVTSTQMMSQAQTSFCESDRSRAEKLGDMARSDGDELTRTLQEQLEDRRQYERFIEQVMQFIQNATNSLYH